MKAFLYILMLASPCLIFAQNIAGLRSQLNSAPPGPAKIKLYKDIITYYEGTQADSAVYYITEGLGLATRLEDRRQQALFMLQLGTANDKLGNNEIAAKLVNNALVILREANDREGLAAAYAELGLIEGKRNGAQAGPDINRAMQLFRASGDTPHIIQTYLELGSIYENRGDIDRSLTYCLEALQRYGTAGTATQGSLDLLDQVGRLYLLKGDAKLALQYLRLGTGQGGGPALADTEARLMDDEGRALERLGRANEALGVYKQELQKAGESRLPAAQARALVGIAGILKAQDPRSSLADLQEALKIAAATNDKQLEASIYKAIAGVYTQEKNYREAMSALDQHHRLLDVLFGEQKAKELAVLDRSYDLVQSREEVESLEASNKKQSLEIGIGVSVLLAVLALLALFYLYLRKVRRLNIALASSNTIKDKLFSVLGHDLRGPVSSAVQIAGMLESGDIDISMQRQLMGTLKKQSTATLETLESVLEWGNVQLKGTEARPEAFGAKKNVEKIMGLLERQANAKQVRLFNDVAPDLAAEADIAHFDTILRNLLSNAIKFSNPGGCVTVGATKEGGRVVFAVRDEGVGIPPEKLRQFGNFSMASSFGTKGEKGTGLGLLLVKEFIAAAGEKIWVESEQGKGTTFYFTVKPA